MIGVVQELQNASFLGIFLHLTGDFQGRSLEIMGHAHSRRKKHENKRDLIIIPLFLIILIEAYYLSHLDRQRTDFLGAINNSTNDNKPLCV